MTIGPLVSFFPSFFFVFCLSFFLSYFLSFFLSHMLKNDLKYIFNLVSGQLLYLCTGLRLIKRDDSL